MLTSFLAIPVLLSVLSPIAGPRIATSSPREVSTQARTSPEERKATVAAKLSLVRRERIRSFWGRMVTRIEAAIERLEILIDRMERRIGIIKETDSSFDTSLAEADIASAKDLIAEANAQLQVAKDSFEEMLTNEDPRLALGQVIENVRQIKEKLVEIHRLLVQTIGEIKGLRVGTGTQTPTP